MENIPEPKVPRLKFTNTRMKKVDRLGWAVGFSLNVATQAQILKGIRGDATEVVAAMLERV